MIFAAFARLEAWLLRLEGPVVTPPITYDEIERNALCEIEELLASSWWMP